MPGSGPQAVPTTTQNSFAVQNPLLQNFMQNPMMPNLLPNLNPNFNLLAQNTPNLLNLGSVLPNLQNPNVKSDSNVLAGALNPSMPFNPGILRLRWCQ